MGVRIAASGGLSLGPIIEHQAGVSQLEGLGAWRLVVLGTGVDEEIPPVTRAAFGSIGISVVWLWSKQSLSEPTQAGLATTPDSVER